MITLKNILTPQELKMTILAVKETKYKFGQQDFILFKKMVLVAGFIHGLEGYIKYITFINQAFSLIKKNISPINTFGFNNRENNDTFFGINKKIILKETIEDIRILMAITREEMLEKKEFIN